MSSVNSNLSTFIPFKTVKVVENKRLTTDLVLLKKQHTGLGGIFRNMHG